MGILDKLAQEFSKTSSQYIGKAADDLVNDAIERRKFHERRWFDNNFFDDGFHFRIVSKKTGKVIDRLNTNSSYAERAIPRASRQIRAVSNLLFAAEPYPVVYPERITQEDFRLPTGQIDVMAFQKAYEQSKQVARKRGNWISNEWEEQELPIKVIDLILLAAKNAISYLQVYSDTRTQEIKTEVYDAFDIVLYGDRRELEDCPFIAKTCPMELKDILSNPMFDEKMVKKLSPDNKYATSEIKDAYMRMRYGAKVGEDKKSTIIVKELFMKEVLSEENWQNAVKLSGDTGALEGKSKGDIIIRHPYTAGGVTLSDEYVDYDCYPFAEMRFEPGNLYQIPYIERFIPQNKSIDVVVTRLERWVNAMIVGVYQKRKGENFQISNFPGGQMVEYETTPLTQMNASSVGNTPFNVIEVLNKYIDEQGATTAGGINVPSGVKSGVAIESVKATEYANLKITTLMIKKFMKKATELMLERADKDYMEPKEVSFIEDSEPEYFDVIGNRGMQLSEKVEKEVPEGVITLKKDLNVRIEMEPGLGLTMQGKKEAMQQIINYMIQMVQAQAMSPEALKIVVKRFMETFGFGSTQEFMEALDENQMGDLTEEQLQKIQIAVAQVMKDLGMAGPELEKTLVDSTKVGVLESLKDAGMLDKVKNKESIPYKDAPPSIKRQMEQQAGFQPSNDPSPSEVESKTKVAETAIKAKNAVDMSKYPINKFRKYDK